MRVAGEEEAAQAVEELRRFLARHEGTPVAPVSPLARKLEAARRAVDAFEEVQTWHVDRREFVPPAYARATAALPTRRWEPGVRFLVARSPTGSGEAGA